MSEDSRAIKHPFDPILFHDTQTLILGSFPSIDAMKHNFYYAHPRNQFWRILEEVTGYPIRNRDQKLWLLKESKLGLWDMVASCYRENALDSQIEDASLNDIQGVLEAHPQIERIAFTGRKAQHLFEAQLGHLEIERLYLPSPSPAYAKMSFEAKVIAYKTALGVA